MMLPTKSVPLRCIESRIEKQFSSTLCVDLDGTVLATDILWESLLILLKQQPWKVFSIFLWALHGPAYLKRQLAQRMIIDPTTLPYRQDILEFLRRHKESGRTLILVTASDRQPAEAIAAHIGIFSDVMASDGIINLAGERKRRALEERFGKYGFDYIGDSRADLKVWPSAHVSILVCPSQALLGQAQAHSSIKLIFSNPQHPSHVLPKALRVHQWVKNVLVFLPLLAAHRFSDVSALLLATMAFLSISLCASSLYLMNDLLDLEADRRHPQKKTRPLASGTLPISTALCIIPVLICGSFVTSWLTLPQEFVKLLGLYCITTIGYSFLLKQVPIMDVGTLAGLYTLRVFAGGLAIDVPISAWLLAFSMFFFLSLAFGKRYSELQFRKVNRHQGLERRGYLGADKEILATMGAVSGYLSVLVLALYINSHDVLNLYHHPQVLWFICPLLLYWISRTWLLANRGNLQDDPLLTAMKDPQSYSVAAGITLVCLFAI